MAKTHIHEITPELTSLDLDGSELLVVSNPHGAGFTDYETNKLSINSLKDFINDGTSSSFGGYEMYDTSENTDGTYSSISEYENSSNNYAWYLEVPRGGTLTKTVTKDCVVWIDGVGVQDDYNPNYKWSLYINNVKIYTFLFRNNNGGRAIYVKRGQELKLETQTYPIKLSVIPLASGGQFFIDTSIAPEQGTLTQNFTYEATRPTLFAHDSVPNVSQTTSPKINGKNVVPMEHGGYSHMSTYFILKTGDILTTVTYSNAAANYAAYALLEDGSGSGGNSLGSHNCIVKFDTSAEAQVDNIIENIQLTTGTYEFEHTLSHDCVFMVGDAVLIPADEWASNGYPYTFTINGISIPLTWFEKPGNRYVIFIKSGQKIKFTLRATHNVAAPGYYYASLRLMPITSSGTFIDLSDPTKLIWDAEADDTNWSSDAGKVFTFTYDYDAVVRPNSILPEHIKSDDTEAGIWIDNVRIVPVRNYLQSEIFLPKGKTLRIVANATSTGTQTGSNPNSLTYASYPIIETGDSGSDTMDSVQLWEGGPYWATKNIGAKRDIDFGEYFQYGSLNGYRYENKVYVGNGSDNYEFPISDSLVYGKSREQLLQAGIITEDNVLTPNYDAATQKFGSEWKIPSYDDWIALNSYCDMYWTRKNGVEGVMITGRNAYADKSIFLPNAGEAGSNGPTDQIRYSSTKVSYGPTTYQAANAECAYFTNSGQSEQVFVQAIRSVQDGLPIRPIKVVS